MRQDVKITILHGIDSRFEACFKSDDLIFAAVTLPQMHLRWCIADDMKDKTQKAF
jgi:hypothetical protein